jgi:hypothetical protein
MEANQSFPTDPCPALDQEARIRLALGLQRGPLPALGQGWLRKYHDYLLAHLSMPFEAQCAADTASFRGPTDPVEVLAILDPLRHPDDVGLVCQVRRGPQEEQVPLVDLEVDEDHPNYQLLEDYWYWVWNWRFDPQI